MSSPALLPPPAQPSSIRATTVLVVDDEPAIRLVLRRTLARDGWTVEEAADGAAALALLGDRGRRYAAVILDVSMPGPSGAQVYEWIRAERAELLGRVVVASGAPAPALERLGCAVLRKPFEIAAVSAVVRRLAGSAPTS